MIENPTQVSEEHPVSKTILFDILSHERRRFALYCLERYQTPMALADLAAEVARLEHDTESRHHLPRNEEHEVYLDLYHSHIPRMEDANLLAYSHDDDTVSLTYDLSDLRLQEFL